MSTLRRIAYLLDEELIARLRRFGAGENEF